jgi:pantetheine-phosphate adenylyltransferase
MKKIAVFPGSFDPFTHGHKNIVDRCLPLFDEVIVAIGVNTTKSHLFTLEQRMDAIRKTFVETDKVRLETFRGLTAEFCRSVDAKWIIRGLRNSIDFEYEQSIASMNKALNPNVETIFLFTDPALQPISSTIVREIHRSGGDISQFVPTIPK